MSEKVEVADAQPKSVWYRVFRGLVSILLSPFIWLFTKKKPKPEDPRKPGMFGFFSRQAGFVKLLLIITSVVWVPFYAIYWLVTGGYRIVYETFIKFIFGSVKDDSKTGEVFSISFTSYSDAFFFIILVLFGFGVSCLQSYYETEYEWAGISFFLVAIFSWIVVKKDIMWDMALKILVWIGLVLLADFGLSKWLSWFPRGVIRPTFDWVAEQNVTASAGFYLVLSIGVACVIVYQMTGSVLYKRYTLDRRDLHQYQYGKKSRKEPIYMYAFSREITDIFEWFFGCADITLRKGNKTIRIPNVFGLAWHLKRPFEELVDNKSERERKFDAREAGVDGDVAEATRVQTFDEEQEAINADGEVVEVDESVSEVDAEELFEEEEAFQPEEEADEDLFSEED